MEKRKPLIVFLSGKIENRQNIAKLIHTGEFDFYAADGGYRYAKEFSAIPNRVFGDFDSCPEPRDCEIIRFPAEKDQTDSEIALELAAKDGYREITMIAPFGGRMDHTIANLSLLENADNKGISLKLYDGMNLAWLLQTGKTGLDPAFRYLSFFPITESAKISLENVKYPLREYTLKREIPLAISNEPRNGAPAVTVHGGKVICICIENCEEDL